MQTVLILLFGLVIFGIPAVLVIWGKRAYDRAADRDLESIYADARRSSSASRVPNVELVYHTYSGILVYVRQRASAEPSLPRRGADPRPFVPAHAQVRFFAYGALLIPVLTYFNLLAQRRWIRQQYASARGGRPR